MNYQAAANTNVRLLTWVQFQEVFEDQWYWESLINWVHENLDPLCSYLEPLPAMIHWDEHLDPEDVERLKVMHRDYMPLLPMLMSMMPYMSMLPGQRQKVLLPIGDRMREHIELPESLTSRTGYREFLVELERFCRPILSEFQAYRDKALARKAAKNVKSS
ncbi:hypothetical protein [Rubellimicrobium roseum]|uniref:Uncharacterized protein n=1 Tax=Rubellimicrobium roseum TaxID=687525 RepID=A0A5C4NCL8_9RHOB|nr:hypothetical protein [Rubellimicrobium roseum]TNC69871.1 hypothetical protein FHG71_13730 [Rubellimicrobium roseum]